jgi:hypothetical protein
MFDSPAETTKQPDSALDDNAKVEVRRLTPLPTIVGSPYVSYVFLLKVFHLSGLCFKVVPKLPYFHIDRKRRKNMELKDLASFFAILTILEPDSKICQFTAKLAEAGSATEGETDSTVLKEIKSHLPELQKELEAIKQNKLTLKEKIISKILTPDI